jgi:glycolate oxidase iron-sulfur subunit
MLALDGCVQSNMAPQINAAAARVLDRAGISLSRVTRAGCCGAIDHHLGHPEAAKEFFRRNIDAWWPHIEQGAEGILVTASGCLAVIRDYGELLADDPAYRDKASRVSELARDPGELLSNETLPATARRAQRVAFHSPCSLQHALKIRGVVEPLLEHCGYELVTTPDAHLCCGSAGTYSILEPELSSRLRDNKLEALQSNQPDAIATANIGCLNHLRSGATVPVRHWIELVDEATG